MKTNIDKKAFNKNFQHYLNLPIEEQERYYTKHLHKDVKTIIHNVLYHFEFTDPNLLKEDVVAELLLHLVYKRDKIATYSDNFYNVLFSIFIRKKLDILKLYKAKQVRIQHMLELRNEYIHLILSRGEEIDLDTDVE